MLRRRHIMVPHRFFTMIRGWRRLSLLLPCDRRRLFWSIRVGRALVISPRKLTVVVPLRIVTRLRRRSWTLTVRRTRRHVARGRRRSRFRRYPYLLRTRKWGAKRLSMTPRRRVRRAFPVIFLLRLLSRSRWRLWRRGVARPTRREVVTVLTIRLVWRVWRILLLIWRCRLFCQRVGRCRRRLRRRPLLIRGHPILRFRSFRMAVGRRLRRGKGLFAASLY